MKICYLGSELETHFSAINLTLQELKKQGHELIIKRWYYDNEEEKHNVNIEADIYLTETCIPQKTRPKGSYWIEFRHGLSPYKMSLGEADGLYARLVPTTEWKRVFDETTKKGILTVATNGWCKMDLYYERLQERKSLRDKIYREYKLDPQKPLVVYAPTGIRFDAMTKREWKSKYKESPNGYRTCGCYYHKDLVKAICSKHANFYEIPHPCVDRTLSAMGRLDLLVASDLLVSDISSIALEYTAMNKPIILLRKNIEDQDPRDFRFFSREEKPIVDLGDIITVGELKNALPYRLAHDDYKEVRNIWRKKLLGRVDGHCAEREAKEILNICRSLGILK